MKVSEYKEMSFRVEQESGAYTYHDDLSEALAKYYKSHGVLTVSFVLKRRQLIESWEKQISKAITAKLSQINGYRAKAGLALLTEDSLNITFKVLENRDNYCKLSISIA